MTSKEAMKRVRQFNQVGLCAEKFLLDIIEKDLEILKILKKHIYFSSKSGCIRMKDIYKSINNFDYEDLKEWLKNEKL